MKNADKKQMPKRRGRGLKIFLAVFLFVSAVSLITASYLFRFDEWHDLDPKLITECDKSLLAYDRNGELVYVGGREKRIPISISELKKHTIDAFVSAEDARFYTHKGLDVYRIFGAAWADIKAGGYVQGASTISQQLIKLSHLSSEKTIDRKLEEAVLATQLERRFSKDEIMEMYLNYIYFGGGFYGIEAASLGYFGIHASELSIAQSAQLAGILKSPSNYAPHLLPDASIKRRNNVLRLMQEYGCISDEEYEAAVNEGVSLSSALPIESDILIERSIAEACRLLGITKDELMTGGYSLYLTLDSRLASVCREIMADDGLYPSENAQGALVVLDTCGGIEAMIGGRGNEDAAGIDRASGIRRQPGSLIKPVLVYAPAIELYGYTAASVLSDEPKSFGDYSPRNSDDKYYGSVTLRTAVAKSLNIPAVSVLSDIGVTSGVMFASRLGIPFDGENIGLPLALGGFTHGVSPLEMAGAYSAFADGGVYIKPACVERITSFGGEVLYSRSISGVRAMSPETAFIITSILQSAAESGTGRRLSEAGVPIAAKTGTTIDENGVRDAWCAAYTTNHTAVIWMGTDTASVGSLPAEAVGGNNTAIVLARLFTKLKEYEEFGDFMSPQGVEEVCIDVSQIEKGRVYKADENTPEEFVLTEYFAENTAPADSDPYFAPPLPPSETGWSIDENGRPVITFIAENELFTYRILRSDAGRGEQAVCAFSGKTGYLSFTDKTTVPGEVYTYRIVAVHPVLKDENGSPLTSEPSRKMRIVTPYYFSSREGA